MDIGKISLSVRIFVANLIRLVNGDACKELSLDHRSPIQPKAFSSYVLAC
jgi:hypothetical protein